MVDFSNRTYVSATHTQVNTQIRTLSLHSHDNCPLSHAFSPTEPVVPFFHHATTPLPTYLCPHASWSLSLSSCRTVSFMVKESTRRGLSHLLVHSLVCSQRSFIGSALLAALARSAALNCLPARSLPSSWERGFCPCVNFIQFQPTWSWSLSSCRFPSTAQNFSVLEIRAPKGQKNLHRTPPHLPRSRGC